jgi:hypothetical protein
MNLNHFLKSLWRLSMGLKKPTETKKDITPAEELIKGARETNLESNIQNDSENQTRKQANTKTLQQANKETRKHVIKKKTFEFNAENLFQLKKLSLELEEKTSKKYYQRDLINEALEKLLQKYKNKGYLK